MPLPKLAPPCFRIRRLFLARELCRRFRFVSAGERESSKLRKIAFHGFPKGLGFWRDFLSVSTLRVGRTFLANQGTFFDVFCIFKYMCVVFFLRMPVGVCVGLAKYLSGVNEL